MMSNVTLTKQRLIIYKYIKHKMGTHDQRETVIIINYSYVLPLLSPTEPLIQCFQSTLTYIFIFTLLLLKAIIVLESGY